MHFWIFPEKDSTIYDDSPTQNAGLDQIIELQKQLIHAVGDYPFNSRILIQFDINDFSASMATSQNSGSNMKWYLNLYTDEAIEIPLSYTVEVYPLSASWEMGNGKRADIPVTKTGVSWNLRDGLSIAGISGSSWVTAGADWISGSNNEYMASQSFEYQTTDLHVDVTTIVNDWIRQDTGSLTNYGFIVKRTHTDETSSLNQGNLQFFSKDTHTIYRPRLEAVWIDSTINPYVETVVSTSYTTISSSDFISHTPVLYYTTQSFYTGSSGFITSSYYTQSGDSNTWYSSSLGIVTESIWSYTASIDLYHSSSFYSQSLATQSFAYTSGSDTIWSSSVSAKENIFSNFYTASLGDEYAQVGTSSVYFDSSSFTDSVDVWTYVPAAGYYFSESFSSVNANYTYVSSSVTGYATASSSTSTQVVWPVGSEDFVVYLTNLKDAYRKDARVRFRIGTREKYPRKTFTTQSWAYTQDQYTLPLTSYYSLRDSWDEYEWIPFSDYTKLSIDATGSYFDVDLNGFEPERFYRILFKVIQSSGSVDEIERVIDNDYSFKVIR